MILLTKFIGCMIEHNMVTTRIFLSFPFSIKDFNCKRTFFGIQVYLFGDIVMVFFVIVYSLSAAAAVVVVDWWRRLLFWSGIGVFQPLYCRLSVLHLRGSVCYFHAMLCAVIRYFTFIYAECTHTSVGIMCIFNSICDVYAYFSHISLPLSHFLLMRFVCCTLPAGFPNGFYFFTTGWWVDGLTCVTFLFLFINDEQKRNHNFVSVFVIAVFLILFFDDLYVAWM